MPITISPAVYAAITTVAATVQYTNGSSETTGPTMHQAVVPYVMTAGTTNAKSGIRTVSFERSCSRGEFWSGVEELDGVSTSGVDGCSDGVPPSGESRLTSGPSRMSR